MGGQCLPHQWKRTNDREVFECVYCGTKKSIHEMSNRELLEYLFRKQVIRDE